MKRLWNFIIFNIIPSGVYCIEAKKTNERGWRLGGVRFSPSGPTTDELMRWIELGKPLDRYKCKVCGRHFWAWRKSDTCGVFACFSLWRS